MTWRGGWFGLATLLALASSALAQSSPSPDEFKQEPRQTQMAGSLSPSAKVTPQPNVAADLSNSLGNSLELVGYFGVLVALVAAGFYFMKRGVPMRGRRGLENKLNILETKMLGNRQFLVVVEYNDNRMLLGVSPGTIQHLCVLDAELPEMEELSGMPNPLPMPKEEKP
ncbi:MAG: flagellar biosynthetic protein FliO [Chthoniobacteraceae bacterium]